MLYALNICVIKKTALNSLCVVNGVRLRKLYDSTKQPHLFFYMKFVINQSEQTLLRCYHSVATDEVISLSEIFFHTHCIV